MENYLIMATLLSLLHSVYNENGHAAVPEAAFIGDFPSLNNLLKAVDQAPVTAGVVNYLMTPKINIYAINPMEGQRFDLKLDSVLLIDVAKVFESGLQDTVRWCKQQLACIAAKSISFALIGSDQQLNSTDMRQLDLLQQVLRTVALQENTNCCTIHLRHGGDDPVAIDRLISTIGGDSFDTNLDYDSFYVASSHDTLAKICAIDNGFDPVKWEAIWNQ